LRLTILGAALCVTLLFTTEGAQAAEFGIVPGSLSFRTVGGAGNADNRAGSHPDRIEVGFELEPAETGTAMKNVVFELPPGLSGNPQAVTGCPREDFDQIAFESGCPTESQVGVAFVRTVFNREGEDEIPIFSVVPPPGGLGELGFAFIAKFPVGMSLRSGDGGINIEMQDLSQVLPFTKVRIVLWGVPADHQQGTLAPRRPFLTTPTRCDSPLNVTLRVQSWQVGAPWLIATTQSDSALTDCGALPFEPHMALGISNPKADSPTGVRIDLAMPNDDDPDHRVASQLRSAVIELPEGMTLSPSGAEALRACSDAQLHLDETEAATCPVASKVGTVELNSPEIRDPLEGNVYLGQERPDDRFRLFAVAKGSGAEVKLISSLRLGAGGRLSVSLTDLPQVPLSRLSLLLEGGSRALVANSRRCGPAAAIGRFEPYDGAPTVESTDTVTIGPAQEGRRCSDDLPFAPNFVAGSTTAQAGRPTALSMTLRRSDGEQLPSRFGVVFPRGLSVSLAGLGRCEELAVSEGSCPTDSRVGSAFAEIGSGPSPAQLVGDVFLTGPYRGAPFGLDLRFRAKLGPFDFGWLTVRAAVRLNPDSGQASIETDALPEAIEGLPVRLRTIGIDIDRPGLVRNPTSCAPSKFSATVWSAEGALSPSTVPFFSSGCRRLGFRPGVSMALTGRSELHRHGTPSFSVTLRARPGDSNIRGADIILPRLLSFDVSSLKAICSLQDASEGACPRAAMVGTADARTSLLDTPLSGGIYVVQPQGTGPPDLWTVLNGSGVRFNIRGTTLVEHHRTHTRLKGLPDISLLRFVMHFTGGDRGAILLTSNPCAHSAAAEGASRAKVTLEGQDRAARIVHTVLSSPACGSQEVG